jgi:UDP-N-acetylglucosamine diphosphorylase/glucosamine-1-phosphate N-acetyltransferase
MRVCLVEDERVTALEPLVATRPVGHLICGITTLAAKQQRYLSATEVGYWCRPHMAAWLRSQDSAGAINDVEWVQRAPTLLVNGRWLPPGGHVRIRTEGGPFVAWLGEEWAYAWLEPEQLATWLEQSGPTSAEWWRQWPAHTAAGRVITHLWELLDCNGAEIARDVAEGDYGAWWPEAFRHVTVLGPSEWLYVHPTAEIEPHVVIDTRPGPVVLEAGVCVQAFSRIEGPCAIGAGSILYGAKIRGGTTIGPQCRIGGEVENSVVIGYTNKYHEGFLGHSYVGAWVNLAAGTHTSDLRCDYAPVTVPLGGKEVCTDRRKVGAFIGDHAKTGLGVLLDAGSVVGPFAQVLPMSSFAPRFVPAFHRASEAGWKMLRDVDRLLATARIVMQRRGCTLTAEGEQLYRSLASDALQTANAQALVDRPATADVVPLRKSA